MAHTPLLRSLLLLAKEYARARAQGSSLMQIRERDGLARAQAESGETLRRLPRRQFLLGSGAIGASALLAGPIGRSAWARAQPRIAIIGGGIAGLTAALALRDAGLAAMIYEALPNRVGGRMLSDRASTPACGSCHAVAGTTEFGWREGQVTDVFGEFIDSDHTTLLHLAKRFGLPLIDLHASQPPESSELFYFKHQHYPMADIERDFAAVHDALRKDLRNAGASVNYRTSTAGGRALDKMSMHAWIESRIPGGHDTPLGSLLDVAYTLEYGADTFDQSALNLIYMLRETANRPFNVFGTSDERYRMQDGIDRLPRAIAKHIGNDTVRLGWRLEAIRRTQSGGYTLTFDADGARTVQADYVILTIPFPALRQVDYTRAEFDALKDRAIRTLGAGRNAKLQLQFDQRLWRQGNKYNGTSFSDTGYQGTWESTRGQGGTGGILVKYTGGSGTDAMQLKHPYGNSGNSEAVRADAARFLTELAPAFPDLTRHWNGQAASSMAHLNPFWGCSYSYWRVGQYQAIAGYEGVRQGNVLFAGEHTSQEYQGFMEGAASSGIRAAREVLRSLKT